MSYLDPSETPQARVSPALLMGAASPLWGFYGAAAAGGLAFWWMTRWTRPVNLESLFDAAMKSPAAGTVEAVVEALIEGAPLDLPPVGGEAAPIGPAVALAPEPEIEEPAALAAEPEPQVEAIPEPVIEAAPEPVLEAGPEPMLESAPEPVVEASPEPVLEATLEPEPVLEPAPEADVAPTVAATPKPRAKKAAAPAASDPEA